MSSSIFETLSFLARVKQHGVEGAKVELAGNDECGTADGVVDLCHVLCAWRLGTDRSRLRRCHCFSESSPERRCCPFCSRAIRPIPRLTIYVCRGHSAPPGTVMNVSSVVHLILAPGEVRTDDAIGIDFRHTGIAVQSV